MGRRPVLLCAALASATDLASAAALALHPGRGIPPVPSSSPSTTRRRWIADAASLAGAGLLSASLAVSPAAAAAEVDALPSELRKYTALAPLGAPASSGNKLTGLPLEELAARLTRDLTVGSKGRGGYFVTGDLSPEIFRDDCAFVDPTNSVSSLSRYTNALRILFDPSESTVQVVEPLAVNEEARTIRGRIRSWGVLQLPWRPRISSYESVITYRVGEDGLIESQYQVWDVAASEALSETFTPGFLAPPYSNVPKPSDEPPEVTQLFDMINGHRPNSYPQEQQYVIADLIDSIVSRRYPWKRKLLPGKWALAYLQPGPDGAGVDRRIPFPEFWFNDSYQVFTPSSVTNVGELLGPLLEVRVSGSLREEDASSPEVPKRFVAGIDGGKICLGAGRDAPCAPLPISGEGLFDGVYLGERMRIGQNLNGGGARVVQVRIT